MTQKEIECLLVNMKIICEKARMANKKTSMNARREIVDSETGDNLETVLRHISIMSGQWKYAYNREREKGNLKGHGEWK